MPTLRCKKCGGDLKIINKDSSLCECEYCGSKETVPTINDEKIIKLYDRANRFRMANEFDKAARIYESIVEESDKEAEAYWGLVLCKYGIEYVDDPASGDKIPTCHRLSFDNIMEDLDFEMVMDNADSISRSVYRKNAQEIDDIIKRIMEISEKEEPYDIFICYKDKDDIGERTVDSVMAQEIYDALTQKGYRVFFSRITLEDKIGQEYEPYIFAALNSAKIMLAFGTSYDYYHSVWVKNEWSRYLKLMAKDKNKRLIPCYKDIDIDDIPREFQHLQAQDMGKVGADQDLLRGIDKLLKNNIEEKISDETSKEEPVKEKELTAKDYMLKLMNYYKVRDINEFANKIVNRIIAKSPEKIEDVIIEPDYDVADLFRDKYVLGSELSEYALKEIKKDLETRVETTLSIISNIYERNNCVEYFCEIDDRKYEDETYFDNECYEKFKSLATDEERKEYDIEAAINVIAKEKLDEEQKRIDSIRQRYSRENVEKIINDANVIAQKVSSNHQSVVSQYEDNKAANDEKIKSIDNRIAELKEELSKFSLIFMAKKKSEISNEIEALENMKKSVITEAMTNYIKASSKIKAQAKEVLCQEFEKHSINLLSNFNVGKCISFGDEKNIEWLILDKQNEKMLIISRYALYSRKFNETEKNSTWKECEVRSWLNDTFMDMHFSLDEKDMILLQSGYEDKIFLLSVDEAVKYFLTDTKRHTTFKDGRSAWWWTRNIGDRGGFEAVVLEDGSVYRAGTNVTNGNGAIRPAMWIDSSRL